MTTDNPAAEIRAAADRMRTTGDVFLSAVADLLDDTANYASLPHWQNYPPAVHGLAVARTYTERH